jgi:hypothetical protein
LVKPIRRPQENKAKYFTVAQVAVRKDVEQAFRVLQTLREIMNACIIMHNMIVKDERDEDDKANEVIR